MRALAALLALSLASAQAAPRLIYDGSVWRGPDVYSPPPAHPAEAGRLTAQVRAAGIRTCGTVRIVQREEGRFTDDRPETLYLVLNCTPVEPAMLPMREPPGDLTVVRAGRVVAYEKNFADGVTVLPSLDGGPLNEVLAAYWSGPHMGEFARYETLYRFQTGRLRKVVNLGPMYREVEPAEGTPTVSVRTLWFDPARPNRLFLIEYTSPSCPTCRNPERPYDPTRARRTLALTFDLLAPPEDIP